MYRLSLKRFVVLISAIGLVFGFMPNAAAHKNTEMAATVTGTVQWPQGDKSPTFDLDRGIGNTDLSLDARAVGSGATREGGLLNGCRLDDTPANPGGGNRGAGLVLSGPQSDLCFLFESGDLVITAVGQHHGYQLATEFDCVSSGTSAASGSAAGQDTGKELTGGVNHMVAPVAVGAFYGEFTCNGNQLDPNVPFLPSADGHFHGQSAAGGAEIAFLGEVQCTVETAEAVCDPPVPHEDEVNFSYFDPPKDGSSAKSRIKHTLSCKGQVTPGDPVVKDTLPENAAFAPDGRTVIREAFVELECVIA